MLLKIRKINIFQDFRGFPDIGYLALLRRPPPPGSRPRRDPHCFDSKFASSDSIPLIFDANSSATTFSEPMVAFIKV